MLLELLKSHCYKTDVFPQCCVLLFDLTVVHFFNTHNHMPFPSTIKAD